MKVLRIGRPPKAPEEKAKASAAKKEYQKKWAAEHKTRSKEVAKLAATRALIQKRYLCTVCDKCFTKKKGLEIHQKISQVHIHKLNEQQQPKPIAPIAS